MPPVTRSKRCIDLSVDEDNPKTIYLTPVKRRRRRANQTPSTFAAKLLSLERNLAKAALATPQHAASQLDSRHAESGPVSPLGPRKLQQEIITLSSDSSASEPANSGVDDTTPSTPKHAADASSIPTHTHSQTIYPHGTPPPPPPYSPPWQEQNAAKQLSSGLPAAAPTGAVAASMPQQVNAAQPEVEIMGETPAAYHPAVSHRQPGARCDDKQHCEQDPPSRQPSGAKLSHNSSQKVQSGPKFTLGATPLGSSRKSGNRRRRRTDRYRDSQADSTHRQSYSADSPCSSPHGAIQSRSWQGHSRGRNSENTGMYRHMSGQQQAQWYYYVACGNQQFYSHQGRYGAQQQHCRSGSHSGVQPSRSWTGVYVTQQQLQRQYAFPVQSSAAAAAIFGSAKQPRQAASVITVSSTSGAAEEQQSRSVISVASGSGAKGQEVEGPLAQNRDKWDCDRWHKERSRLLGMERAARRDAETHRRNGNLQDCRRCAQQADVYQRTLHGTGWTQQAGLKLAAVMKSLVDPGCIATVVHDLIKAPVIRRWTLQSSNITADQEALKAREQANKVAFQARNAHLRGIFRMDLHGLNQPEALQKVHDQIRALEALNAPGGWSLEVVTGWGRHSPTGTSIIKQSVLQFLESNQYAYEFKNVGNLLVYLGGNTV